MRSLSSILIVDDDPEVLETLVHLFCALNVANVHAVDSAEAALDMLDQFSPAPEMIVCDYQMVGMSGVEFVERLRGSGNQTPILLISGSPEKEAVIRACRYERVDFYSKPIRLDQFMNAIDRLAA
jgi:CheY-like chemotaxis protein